MIINKPGNHVLPLVYVREIRVYLDRLEGL